VSWPVVTRPKELGGLGIADLKTLGWALRVRWLWLQKTQPDKPWAYLPLKMSPCVCSFFSMAVCTEIGDGSNTLFWKDRWLHGQSVQDLAPKIFCMIPKRIANKRTVQDAMQQGRWIQDIHGEATWAAMAEFLVLWDTVSDISPQQGISDKHVAMVQFRTVHSEICIPYTSHRLHPLWAVEEHLENLGTGKMPFLPMVGCPRPLLDSRQTSAKKLASSRVLSPM
jgi:hypothetical protein